jgi:hypothetical protein
MSNGLELGKAGTRLDQVIRQLLLFDNHSRGAPGTTEWWADQRVGACLGHDR